MLFTQFLETDIIADIAVQHIFDARSGQAVGAAGDDVLFQLERRDAVNQQAAGAVIAVIDGDLIAERAQAVGGGDAGRAGADDADRLRPLDLRPDRLDPAVFKRHVAEITLDTADGDVLPAGLLQHARTFAQTVLRADAAADFRQGGGGR